MRTCAARVSLGRATALAAVAAVAVALVAFAGCGGGGSSAPTKAQYVAKVNAICFSEHQQLNQLALTKTRLLAKVSESIVIRERANAKIEAVKNPSSGAISPEWLQARRRALSATKKIAASKPGSSEARAENRAFITAANRALELAHAYGLDYCHGFATV